MKLAKFSNFIGVFAGVLFLVLAVGISADEPMAFINLPGLLIVLGGTMTAMLVSFPLKEVLAALKQGRVVTESLNRDFSRETKQIFSVRFPLIWESHWSRHFMACSWLTWCSSPLRQN